MSEAAHHQERQVTILVNNKPVEVPRDTTGLQIKEAAGVPPEFKLYLRRGANLDEIGNDQPIEVHEREQFVAVSGQDVS
jgi:Multiubiquitin